MKKTKTKKKKKKNIDSGMKDTREDDGRSEGDYERCRRRVWEGAEGGWGRGEEGQKGSWLLPCSDFVFILFPSKSGHLPPPATCRSNRQQCTHYRPYFLDTA